jgi:TM2 domain-containing membrane protein YozV
MKTKPAAYACWTIGVFGLLGLHRFYLGKVGTGLIWFFTLGLFGVGALMDAFTLGQQVDAHNTKIELRQLRVAGLARKA